MSIEEPTVEEEMRNELDCARTSYWELHEAVRDIAIGLRHGNRPSHEQILQWLDEALG